MKGNQLSGLISSVLSCFIEKKTEKDENFSIGSVLHKENSDTFEDWLAETMGYMRESVFL